MVITTDTILVKMNPEIETPQQSISIGTAFVTYDNGVEVARGPIHRYVVEPGIVDSDGEWFDSDLTAEDVRVQGVASTLWTPAVKSATHLSGALKALEAAQGSVDATSQAVVAIEARIALLEDGADAELPSAEAAKTAAIAKRDTVQGNIDLI